MIRRHTLHLVLAWSNYLEHCYITSYVGSAIPVVVSLRGNVLDQDPRHRITSPFLLI